MYLFSLVVCINEYIRQSLQLYLEVITRLYSYRPVYQGRASIISPRR